jgi:hypothetical protein
MLPGLWLIAAIPITMLVVAPLSLALNMGTDTDNPILIAGFSLGHIATGYLWAQALLRRAEMPKNRLAALAAGIGFALFVVGGYGAFAVFDTLIDLLGVRGINTEHLEFGVIFVTWTGLVAGGTGLALGLGMRDWKLALKLLASGFLTGAGVFLAIALLMDRASFRVGEPRPDGIPSMPVITVLGIWSAALVGSGVFGWVLRSGKSSVQAEAPALDTLNLLQTD